eukprot:CAMPEP_0115108996 /NCGR_PEP_ID=MMETSP0227-20121206/38372_1 /TAXON_ID=89957 /ORGANISM="Polarella glacialis, Strain CCMP 1383" /LENGTH=269 /DNA_ID=CAMNT_0002507469 /DNA_START=259 /DNA_END=1068 /DNA_ORIENTATION=+
MLTKRSLVGVLRPWAKTAAQSACIAAAAAASPAKEMLIKRSLVGVLRPWAKTAAQSACIAAAADLTTQWLVSEKKATDLTAGNWSSNFNPGGLDLVRAGSFAAFGFLYGGFIQRLVYLKFDAVFGVQSALAVVAKKVAADSLLHAPLMYVPMFYLATGLLQGHGLSASVDRLNSNYSDTLRTYLMIWPGAMFAMFRYVPERKRCIFLACCAFFEKAIYSWLELRSRSPGLVIESKDLGVQNQQQTEISMIRKNDVQILYVNGAFFSIGA